MPLPVVVFQPHPHNPVFYQSATKTYYLCPECLRPYETRSCSGTTEISHKLCEKHSDVITSKSAALLSDLNFFRTEILNKKLFPTKTNSQILPPQAPSRKVIYEHSSTCLHSDNPEAVILSKSAIHLCLAHDLSHLAKLREQYTKYEIPEDIIAHAKLLQEVETNYVCRGVYLRRCNGQFVNALWEKMDEKTAIELNDGNDASLKAGAQAVAMDVDTLSTCAMQIRVEEESLLDTPVSSSTTASDTVLLAAKKLSDDDHHKDNASDTGSDHTVTAATTPASSLLTPPFSTATTAVLAPPPPSAVPKVAPASTGANPEDSFFPFDGTADPTTTTVNNTPKLATIVRNQALETNADAGLGDDAEVQTSKSAFPLFALQQREMLVRAGRMDDDDLIMTCWAVNGQDEHNIAAAVKAQFWGCEGKGMG